MQKFKQILMEKLLDTKERILKILMILLIIYSNTLKKN